MSSVKVSIIIPTYRHQQYILATLESVFTQTFTDFEVIVVNDGSPDNTAEVLKPLVNEGRIRYIEQQNQGQAAARNRGIAEAKGEFIALLDDDDLWPPDKLQWQVETLVHDPQAVLVYGEVWCINDNGERFTPLDNAGAPLSWLTPDYTGHVRDQLLVENFIVTPGLCLLRRKALDALGEVPFDFRIQGGCDDWDLYLRLSAVGTFQYKRKHAITYRLHANNASNNKAEIAWSSLMVRRKYCVPKIKTPQSKRFQDMILNQEIFYIHAVRRQVREGTLKERGKERFIVFFRFVLLYRAWLTVFFWEGRERVGALKRRYLKT